MFVIKRDNTQVPFDLSKIVIAIKKAFLAKGTSDEVATENAKNIALEVECKIFVPLGDKFQGESIGIEKIQDLVETALMQAGHREVAKAYIQYRDERAEMRRIDQLKPTDHFNGDTLGEFVFERTYARFNETLGRRETWPETVERYMDFMRRKLSQMQRELSSSEYDLIQNAILKMEVMPSMRLLQFSGPAAERCNACVYNCSYIAPTTPQDLADIIYLLMSGCGVGFSVEAQNVNEFPVIKPQSGNKAVTITVQDSKEGWAQSFADAMTIWLKGSDVSINYDLLRPAGAILKTTGGRSSGPQPLKDLMNFTRELILSKPDQKLSTMNMHDIICKIGQIVVAGGVRRSALISLSDLSDHDIRDCKNGPIWNTNPQRYMSNNSAVYVKRPSDVELMQEMLKLAENGTGERGIFNRGGVLPNLSERRRKYFASKPLKDAMNIGLNPCGEIILKSHQFCNLTEVVCRENDTLDMLKMKVKIATMIGTYQSSLVDFKFISEKWRVNQEQERLLGVSLTGLMDCKLLNTGNTEHLNALKDIAVDTNEIYSRVLGIQRSTAVTCVKPSGTVSQMTNSSSGIHARYSPYYIRRVRIAAHDPLFKLMKDQGYPCYPEVGQDAQNPNTWVLEFPVASPKGAICTKDMTALDQLEFWKKFKLNYTEHNPSVTISVKPNEWIDVQHWVSQNWDLIAGLSFLPFAEHIYALAPYEEITEEEYLKHPCRGKTINFALLQRYEKSDTTDMKRVVACSGTSCEL